MFDKFTTQSKNQQTIVRYVESSRVGIQLLNLSRCAIGYLVRGEKRIYCGDTYRTVLRGEIFFLGMGAHYVEDIPEEGKNFEQIVVFYSPALLQRIFVDLNTTYLLNLNNNHLCERCRNTNFISVEGRGMMHGLFTNIWSYLQDDNFIHDETAEYIKMTEIIYLIVVHGDNCLKALVLKNADASFGDFEQLIYANLFNEISLEELASQSHRSLTSFKKEFKRHFTVSPHRWFTHQRLMRSRILLISTSLSISEIGNECAFPNTSHFIKLFKKEYGTTPAAYRYEHCHRKLSIGGGSEVVTGESVVESVAL